MKSSYHTHTKLCKHATETAEEAIKGAISIGLETLGFSEHVPLPYDNGANRINTFEEFEDYVKNISRLKEKYKDQINIKIGAEVDIENPNKKEESLEEWHKKLEGVEGLEYTIIGHHTIPQPTDFKRIETYLSKYRQYISYSKKLMYIAHPDVFMANFDEPNEVSARMSKEIIEIAIEHDLPLGININSMMEGKKYPSDQFFSMASKMGAKTILELDSHTKGIWDHKWIKQAEEFAEKNGLDPINK